MNVPLVMPVEAMSVRVLVLTESPADWFWYLHLMQSGPLSDVEVGWCQDPRSGKTLIASDRFDLLLWDRAFHDSSPQNFLHHLVSICRDRPVIALSAEDEDSMTLPVLLDGAVDYLSKSRLDAWSLCRAIKAACYQRWAQQAAGLPGKLQDAGLPGKLQDVACGFVNRDLFVERLHQAVLRAQRQQHKLALLHINLDDFRLVNDTFGFSGGDRLVVQVAERLRGSLRRTDMLMRIGGDELAIIVEQIEGSLDVSHILCKLTDSLALPFHLDCQWIAVTLSIGIATWPDVGDSVEQLMRQANRAMFEAKREAGNSHRFYNQQLHERVGRQLELEADLRQALRGNQLELFYQPRLDLLTG